MSEARTRTIILGAAGRDFHNFNMLFRDDPATEVVAFTAQQIPHIADRRYPAELSGPFHPDGVPIHDEAELESLVAGLGATRCVMAYSDVSHEAVMHLASRANAAGADFLLVAAARTMLRPRLPAVAVCATRTGAGKSQTSRAIANHLRHAGLRVGVIRHPMPYGELAAQRVQRFATKDDLARHRVTIEEREEFEPHMAAGSIVYAGVDYAAILQEVEREADVLLWDGGNNDTPFLAPTLHFTVADPHRAGHELRYYPGETNVRLADIVIVNKVDTAAAESVAVVETNVRSLNPRATIVRGHIVMRDDELQGTPKGRPITFA